MPYYLNLSVVFQYDFIVTYLAVIFFIHWVIAKFQIARTANVLRRVWERRNKRIRFRGICHPQNSSKR